MSFSLHPLQEKYSGELHHEFKGCKGLAEMVRKHIKDNKNGIFKGCKFKVRIGNTNWSRYHCLDIWLDKAPFNPYQGETEPYHIPDLSAQAAAVRDSLRNLLSKYYYSDSHIMSDYHNVNFYAELHINYDPEQGVWWEDIKDKQ